MLAIANVLWAQAGPKVEDIAWLLCPLHLVPSRPRQVLKCESRQAHICLVGRSEESWLLRAMYTVAWPRKRSLEAGDVQTRLLSSSAKCIPSTIQSIQSIQSTYIYIMTPARPFLPIWSWFQIPTVPVLFLSSEVLTSELSLRHISVASGGFEARAGKLLLRVKNVGF